MNVRQTRTTHRSWATAEVPAAENRARSFFEGITFQTLLRSILPFLAMVLLGRAEVLDGIRPFAGAFCMAATLCGYPPIPLLLGCAFGALFAPFSLWAGLTQLVACAAMPMIVGALRRILKREIPAYAAALIASFCVLAAYTLMGSKLMYDLLQSALSAVFAGLLTIVFARALRVPAAGRRTVLSTDEVVSISLSVSILLLGVADLSIWRISVSGVFTVLLCLLSGYLGGAGAGAATGVLLGVVLSLSGGDRLFLPGTLGLCGLLAGSMRSLKRVGSLIAFFAGELMTAAYIGERSELLAPVWEILLAGGLFLAIPPFVIKSLHEAVDVEAHQKAGQHYYARRIRELTVKRLLEFSGVFKRMGQAFTQLVDNRSESLRNQNDEVLMNAAGSVCDGCGLKSRCWQREPQRTVTAMRDLMAAIREDGPGDVPDFWKRFCLRPAEMTDTLAQLCAMSDMEQKWQSRVQDCRRLVGEQLDGVSSVVQELALQLDEDVHFCDDAARRVLEDADRAAVRVREVLVQEDPDGHIEAHLEMRACKDGSRCDVELPRILRGALGRPMRRVESPCAQSGWCQLTYVEARGYSAETAVCQRAAADVCGDSYVIRELPGGKLLMVISDGMGTGLRASQESRMTVGLLEEFFRAGFDDDLIFRAINQLMLLRKPEEMFSTVDLCLVDLITGTSEFIKIGATFGCLRRAGRCQVIRSNSLPLGIVEDVSPYVEQIALQDGDQIVLVSDGIADVVGDRGEKWLQQALEIFDAPHPQDVADAIVREAVNRDGTARDDMTILVARIHRQRA